MERYENYITWLVAIIIVRLLVGMIVTLVWEGNLHTAKAKIYLMSTQMQHTAFWAIAEIGVPEKKA